MSRISLALIGQVILISNVALIASSPFAWPAYPGANGKIAFESGPEFASNSGIFVMNPDGTNLIRLTTPSDNYSYYSPAWSPDGSKIAFGCSRRNGDKFEHCGTMFVMNADGSGMTSLKHDGHNPSWSPDGSMIAFQEFDDQTWHDFIYVMNIDGSNVRRLTKGMEPAWSPDGSKIAFTGVLDGQKDWDIYVMNANGGGIRRLTNNAPSDDLLPDWSPDGSEIAFVSDRDGDNEIFVMSADGSHSVQLTFNSADTEWAPDWSPDGSKIAFVCSAAICVMNPDGSGTVQLTQRWSYDPDWQRVSGSTETAVLTRTQTQRPLSIQTEVVKANTVAWAFSASWALILAALVVLAPVAYFLSRRGRGPVSETLLTGLFEVSVSVPSVGKTVTLEAAPDHTIGSLVESIASALNLPKGRSYAVEHAGRLISQPEFARTLGALGIKEGSKLSLRVVE